MKRKKPEWISSREYAARLGVHRTTITRWAQRGLLPSWRLGGVLRFDWSAAEAAASNATTLTEVDAARRGGHGLGHLPLDGGSHEPAA